MVDLSMVGFYRSCFGLYFFHSHFIQYFMPTEYNHCVKHVDIDGTRIALDVWDTTDLQICDPLGPLAPSDTHVILICYAVNDARSLDHVQEKWLPDARRYCPDVPLLLVGLKKDLRQGSRLNGNMVSEDKATLVAQQINAVKYLECSAKTGEGVFELFDYATRVALEYNPIKSQKYCVVL